MNKIQFDIISPHWERFGDNPDWDDRYVYAQISIIIDGKDIFNEYEHMGKPRFAGMDPETFLFNKEPLFIDTPETNKLNGTILIGVCNICFFEGCGDLYAESVPYGGVITEWDGETLESALKNLIIYAEQNLIKI